MSHSDNDPIKFLANGNVYINYDKVLRRAVERCQDNKRQLNNVAVNLVAKEIGQEVCDRLWEMMNEDLEVTVYPESKDLRHLPGGEPRRLRK